MLAPAPILWAAAWAPQPSRGSSPQPSSGAQRWPPSAHIAGQLQDKTVAVSYLTTKGNSLAFLLSVSLTPSCSWASLPSMPDHSVTGYRCWAVPVRISPSNPSPFSTLEKPRMRNGSLEVMFLAQVVCFFSWDVFPCAGGLVSASSFRKKCRHITCIIVVPKVGWFYLVCKTPIYTQSRGVLLPFTFVQRWGQGGNPQS